jgi:hypothetical protein
MNKFIRILRDPDSESKAGADPEPQLPPGEVPPEPKEETKPAAQSIPKTKEDWERLSKEDPQRWISLTQTRMDQTIRQSREVNEKLAAEQARAKNLEAELENFRRGQKPEIPVEESNKVFSRENLPKSNEDWDQLWIENPNLASDLRSFKFQKEQEVQNMTQAATVEFAKARKESAKMIWDRHPDMYVQETDDQGNVRLDEKGKPVLRIDPNTNGPMLNLEHEKAKLFVQVYSEDPNGYDGAKFGPRLAMVEMERRLQDEASRKIQDSGQPPEGQSQEQKPDQRGVLPGGVTPPVSGKVSFNSDDEKMHATKAVERGIYKNLEEYCQLRDGKGSSIEEENRFPVFK